MTKICALPPPQEAIRYTSEGIKIRFVWRPRSGDLLLGAKKKKKGKGKGKGKGKDRATDLCGRTTSESHHHGDGDGDGGLHLTAEDILAAESLVAMARGSRRTSESSWSAAKIICQSWQGILTAGSFLMPLLRHFYITNHQVHHETMSE